MSTLRELLIVPALTIGLAVCLPVAAPAGSSTAQIETSVIAGNLKPSKQTQTGLYITAAEAAALIATRDDILLLDVRTPEETVLVGHPTTADANIPFALFAPDHPYKTKSSTYAMTLNPNFIATATAYIKQQAPSTVLVMCRSGGRSAKAIDALVTAGVTLPLYSIVDGFEGDKDSTGKRTVNGWKNAGAPWSYKVQAGFLLSSP